ncbi:hypothetical protein [Paenibacillus senegalensis]|uniref:hypothetical protein n=1 Tax=Paenibacillus senegalensis TaxID=1465766 RepID=UPI0002880DF4|nr:hypothetical protein [Paenibacillus senegalensis]
MKCISVYTNNFESFSDIYEEILEASFEDNEEKEFQGVVVSEAGTVPDNYLERMRAKPEVVVMKIKDTEITILQHGDVFEILLPEKESVVN